MSSMSLPSLSQRLADGDVPHLHIALLNLAADTLVLAEDWPELLRVLRREQHPRAPEQATLDFVGMPAAAELALIVKEKLSTKSPCG